MFLKYPGLQSLQQCNEGELEVERSITFNYSVPLVRAPVMESLEYRMPAITSSCSQPLARNKVPTARSNHGLQNSSISLLADALRLL